MTDGVANMELEATGAVMTTPQEYVWDNLAGARRHLAEARALLMERPAIVAPKEHVDRAASAARTAAEHLFDVGQADDPVEPVREALAAAEAIMIVVRDLENPDPTIADPRALAAAQLQEVDGTLAALERALGITHPRA